MSSRALYGTGRDVNPLGLKSFKEHQFLLPKKGNPSHLMICFHGQGGNLLDLRKVRAKLKLDHFAYLFLNAPFDCTKQEGKGGFEWHGARPFHRQGILASIEKLEELQIELSKRGFQTQNTLLTGFSQGAVIGLEWALRGKHRFLGVVSISGWIFEPADLLNRLGPFGQITPVLMTHGPQDQVIHFGELKQRFETVAPILSNITFHSINKGHEIHSSEYPIMRSWIMSRLPLKPDITSLGLGI